jgi:small conductance mechanosensitive channel
MDFLDTILEDLSLPLRAVFFVAFAVAAHLLVLLVRATANRVMSGTLLRNKKAHSVTTLATSALVFAVYFFAVGLMLRELGLSLTAYLASASVIGLAVGFGSQGIVQDVVTGLTFIFSDVVDVGDLVEVSGQTGRVRAITMRFVELENAMGASVFVPNRTINNVINYPRGYIRCLVDVTLRGDAAARQTMADTAGALMQGAYEQFPGILLTQPSIEGRKELSTGKEFLRIKFRIWPNRGQPIETTFVKELAAQLKEQDPAYQDWMISVSYEVEERVRRRR